LEAEIDDLIDALAKLRPATPQDAKPATAKPPAPSEVLSFRDSVTPTEQRRRSLLDRRRTLRARLSGDPDPELKLQIEEVERALRALDEPTR
jgi:hypothetical protein